VPAGRRRLPDATRGDGRRPRPDHRPAVLRRLTESGVEVAAEAFVAGLGLRDSAPVDSPAGPRPRLVAVMIASVDGRAAIEGRSVKLGHPDDRALLRGMRAGADAVLVGSRTLVAEGYRNLLDADQRAARVAAGMPAHPVVATVSRAGTLRPGDAPLFDEPGARVAVYRAAEPAAAPPAAAAPEARAVDTVARGPEPAGGFGAAAADVAVHALDVLDFVHVLAHLHATYDVRSVSCEGGPHLLRELAAQGCVDDLLVTVAPLLVAGDGPALLTGPALPTPAPLRLRDVHRADDHLFLHYAA